MDKRGFLKTLGIGAASIALAEPLRAEHKASPSALKSISPVRIMPGDAIGFISPSSALVDPTVIDSIKSCFEGMGFRTKWGHHILDRYGHLAGRDEDRVADIHNMFADPEVRMIVCLRGGSGAARLLDKLDYNLIRNNAKIFLGYSDITAFHQAIHTQTGLITFHGHVATSNWTAPILEQFFQIFVEGNTPHYSSTPISEEGILHAGEPIAVIRPGTAEGKLLGGNLTVLTGIAGSSYYPDFQDSILFLEDIGEQPYRIDRMMSQLALSGALSKIKGFIFGQCTDCGTPTSDRSLTLEQIFHDHIYPLGIPAFTGAMIGHIDEQFIVPVGGRVHMDAGSGSFYPIERIIR